MRLRRRSPESLTQPTGGRCLLRNQNTGQVQPLSSHLRAVNVNLELLLALDRQPHATELFQPLPGHAVRIVAIEGFAVVGHHEVAGA